MDRQKKLFEKLYCKGWMSNPLLLQQSSQPIRSSLRQDSRKEVITGRNIKRCSYGAMFALYAPDMTQRGRSPSTTTSGHTPQKGAFMPDIDYIRHGDYLLPNIRLSDPPDAPPLGRYCMMHKAYLREHRPILYSQLLLLDKLYPLCREVGEAAANRLKTIENREVAHEVILTELVYN